MFSWQTLNLWIDRFVVPVDDPGSRLFHLNLISSLTLVLLFAVYNRKPLAGALFSAFLERRYWWNTSTKIDYQIYALNSLLKIFIFIPFLDFSFRFSQWSVKGLLALNGGEFAGFSDSVPHLLAFTVVAFVFDDFLRFFHHYLMHRYEFLWVFHKTHHSARVLTPITLYRTHPLESALAALRNSISIGVSTGVFVFLFESQLSLLTFLGVNMFGFVFNFLGSNLRHSHIPLSFGALESVFISPKMHQIHHSRRREDFDHNFGVSLSIWDALWGCRRLSKERPEKIRVGLDERHAPKLWSHLGAPVSQSIFIFKTFSSVLWNSFILKAEDFFANSGKVQKVKISNPVLSKGNKP